MTSGGMQGMDTEWARQSAQSMDGGAGAINGMVGNIGSMLEGVLWIGPSAARFKQDWHGTFVPQLTGATNALSDNAHVLRARADMQDEASRN